MLPIGESPNARPSAQPARLRVPLRMRSPNVMQRVGRLSGSHRSLEGASMPATVPYGRKTQRPSPVSDIHVLWITAGLGCDGDSVSITAATQPSIEDVLLGAIPGLPKVHLHNPVLAYEVGDDFMKFWYDAEAGKLDPVRARASKARSPTRRSRSEGYWAAMGTDKDRPADHDQRVDRPAGPQGASPWSRSAPAPPMAASTPWPAIPPAHGPGRLPRLGAGNRRPACPIVNVPGCPVQPDNFMETLLYLLYQAAGLAPMIPLDDAAAAHLAVRQDRPRRLRPRRLLRAGRLRHRVRLAQVHREARLLGAGGQLQRAQARLDGRHRRLPERRRHLHRLHHARLPRQVHALHGRAARREDLVDRGSACTARRSARSARITNTHGQQGAEVAASAARADHRLSTQDLRAMAERSDHDGGHHHGPTDRDARRPRNLVEMSWDPDHPDRRQPGHLHQDRLRQPAGRRVLTAPRRSSAATASS